MFSQKTLIPIPLRKLHINSTYSTEILAKIFQQLVPKIVH